MNKLVHEVLEEARKKRSKEEKIKVLRDNATGALRDVIRGTYDDRIVWLLPQGAPPPFTRNEDHSTPTNFIKECVKLKYLVKGGGFDDIHQTKREQIFIGLLEGIHSKDSELLINMINKEPIKGITKNVAMEAFPDLFPKN